MRSLREQVAVLARQQRWHSLRRGFTSHWSAAPKSKLEAVATAAAQYGVTVRCYPVDLFQVEHVQEKIATIAASFGPIDILVNNAGMGYTATLAKTPLADWQRVLTLNLTSVFQCIQGILPMMRDRQQGTIINVSSIAGQQVFPEWGAYCVSKFGLVALSKTLAAEERYNGIRVITISPWFRQYAHLGYRYGSCRFRSRLNAHTRNRCPSNPLRRHAPPRSSD